MIVANLEELLLYPVADRGVPNAERIPIFVRERIDLGQFGLMIGYSAPDKFAMPIKDNLYWFGDGFVNPGDWIMLYTGNGSPRTDDLDQKQGSKMYTIHWGRAQTMFAHSQIVPVLFKIDAVDIGVPPGNLPQLEQS